MGMESDLWYNTMCLIGNTEKKRHAASWFGTDGHAWHFNAGLQEREGLEPNHYPGFIPVADVRRRLFNFQVIEAPTCYVVPGMIENAVVTYSDAEGNPFSVVMSQADRKGMLCDDNYYDLGCFKSGYQGHDYDDTLLKGLTEIVDQSEGELGIASAMLLRNRGQAIVTIETPETITTPEGLDFRPFLAAMTSYDGTLATTYGAHVTEVICDNTRDVALGEMGDRKVKIKHSRYSSLKVASAREALGIIFTVADSFANEVAALSSWKVDDVQFEKHLNAIVPIPEEKGKGQTVAEKKQSEILHLYRADERAATWNGTALGVLQAHNTWMQHMSQVRGDVHRLHRHMENTVSGKFHNHDMEVLTVLNSIVPAPEVLAPAFA